MRQSRPQILQFPPDFISRPREWFPKERYEHNQINVNLENDLNFPDDLDVRRNTVGRYRLVR